MNILLLKGFNNYFNRIAKKYDTLDDYKSESYAFLQYADVNFNPADGVDTTLTVGSESQLENNKPLDWDNNYTGSPDYLVCYEMVKSGDVFVPEIISRWFVMHVDRSRKGQYTLKLKRDVVVEHLDALLNNYIFIEKGIIPTASNKLVYNSEGMNLNQIKKTELLLKDETEVPWLVMYLEKKAIGKEDQHNENDIIIDTSTSLVPDAEVANLENWSGYPYIEGSGNFLKQLNVANLVTAGYYQDSNHFYIHREVGVDVLKDNTAYFTHTAILNWGSPLYNSNLEFSPSFSYFAEDLTRVTQQYSSTYDLYGKVLSSFGYVTSETVQNYRYGHYVGRYLLKVGNAYYKVEVKARGDGQELTGYHTITSTQSQLHTNLNEIYNKARHGTDVSTYETANNTAFGVNTHYYEYYLKLTPIQHVGAKANMKQIHNHTNNGLYDVICMPYGECHIRWNSNVDSTNHDITFSKETALSAAYAIAEKLTSSQVYDLQLLPYCPLRDFKWNNLIEVTSGNSVLEFRKTSDTTVIMCCAVVASETDISFSIRDWRNTYYQPGRDFPEMQVPQSVDGHNYVETVKYWNECMKFRLCSPNYAGVFEFSPAKNIQPISRFDVDMSLKPHNPYIHVAPQFAGLYGQDFNDSRGLVCGGDFSLGIINNQWEQYQIQNKNFQAMFDRQIQSMEVSQQIAREQLQFQNIVGGLAGTVGGGVSGAMAGSKAGPYGAIAGAAVGAVGGLGASVIGAQLNRDWMNRAQGEAIDYAIDNFNMSLQNIMALPNSITKTDAITNNNKLFPFIEIYECTEEEKNAFFNKLELDGMTVGVIDVLANWVNPDELRYVKGQLIRGINIDEDNHFLMELYNRLNNGVYIKAKLET